MNADISEVNNNIGTVLKTEFPSESEAVPPALQDPGDKVLENPFIAHDGTNTRHLYHVGTTNTVSVENSWSITQTSSESEVGCKTGTAKLYFSESTVKMLEQQSFETNVSGQTDLSGHNIAVSEGTVCPLNVSKLEVASPTEPSPGTSFPINEPSADAIPSSLFYLFFDRQEPNNNSDVIEDVEDSGESIILHLDHSLTFKRGQRVKKNASVKDTTLHVDKDEMITLCRAISPFAKFFNRPLKPLPKSEWYPSGEEKTQLWDLIYTALVEKHPHLKGSSTRRVIVNVWNFLKTGPGHRVPRNSGWAQVYAAAARTINTEPTRKDVEELREKLRERVAVYRQQFVPKKKPRMSAHREPSVNLPKPPLNSICPESFNSPAQVKPLVDEHNTIGIELESDELNTKSGQKDERNQNGSGADLDQSKGVTFNEEETERLQE